MQHEDLARSVVTTDKERRCTGERPLCATRVVGEDSRQRRHGRRQDERQAAPSCFPSGLLAWCVEVQRANEGGQRLAHLGTRVWEEIRGRHQLHLHLRLHRIGITRPRRARRARRRPCVGGCLPHPPQAYNISPPPPPPPTPMRCRALLRPWSREAAWVLSKGAQQDLMQTGLVYESMRVCACVRAFVRAAAASGSCSSSSFRDWAATQLHRATVHNDEGAEALPSKTPSQIASCWTGREKPHILHWHVYSSGQLAIWPSLPNLVSHGHNQTRQHSLIHAFVSVGTWPPSGPRTLPSSMR